MNLVARKVACGIFLLFAHSECIARTETITYVGTVKPGHGIDSAGLFGTPGADISGTAYTATFLINDHVSGAVLIKDPTQQQLVGGAGYLFGTSPPVAGRLEINGRTILVTGTDEAAAVQYYNNAQPSGLVNGVAEEVRQLRGPVSGQAGLEVNLSSEIVRLVDAGSNAIVSSADLFAPLTYTVTAEDSLAGYFEYNPFTSFSTLPFSYTRIYFDPHTVTVALGSAPDPASWLTMALGFGAIGACWRKQRCASLVTLR